MGFDTALVLSGTEHVSEFICPICVQLIDYESATILQCSHVFCGACVSEWFDGPSNSRLCPVCKANVFGEQHSSAAISGRSLGAPLRTANPLAFRIMNQIRVKCPLNEQGCRWEGDYSEVNSHLTSSSAHTAETIRQSHGSRAPLSGEATAMALKDQANTQFQARNFQEAIKLYSKAISVCPALVVLRLNRAAAYLMLGRHVECIADCDVVTKADPLNAKAYLRKSKAYVQLGQLSEAIAALQAGIRVVQGPPPSYGATPPAFDAERADALTSLRDECSKVEAIHSLRDAGAAKLESGEFGDAARLLGEVLTHCDSSDIQLLAARAQLGVGVCDWATRVTLQILRTEPRNPTAYAVRAEALFLLGELDDAMRLVRQGLKLNPDDVYGKRVFKRLRAVQRGIAEAKVAGERRDFAVVVSQYSDMIGMQIPDKAPLFATLYAERANGLHRLGRHEEALRDCSRAIYTKDDCRSAWLTKRLALHALGRHEEALREMATLMQGWGQSDSTVRHAHQQAEFEMRKSKRPDYYALMGCKRVASEREIKAAYRSRALEQHPDKHTNNGAAELAKAEADFKMLGEALEILTDTMKRQLYDEGYDKAAIDERVAAAHRAARSNDNHRGGGGHHH
eukprot:m.37854 g.37854  ORF g.37854 m.37854 type:complete len:625 (-) comp13232_c0_seq2:147-2021(-)